MLSDHFWGVNSDFCANFINQNSFCDIRENTPKSYGMGLSPPPYGKCPQFCDFFVLMASLRCCCFKITSSIITICCFRSNDGIPESRGELTTNTYCRHPYISTNNMLILILLLSTVKRAKLAYGAIFLGMLVLWTAGLLGRFSLLLH